MKTGAKEEMVASSTLQVDESYLFSKKEKQVCEAATIP